MPFKRIEEVDQTRNINGEDKLLIVKTDDNNVTRSVTVDDFIHDNSINTGEICNNAITEPKISDGAIETRHMTANTIDGCVISTGTLDAGKITTGTLDASKVNVTNLDASCITSGKICGDLIEGLTISADCITGLSITADDITSGTLDAGCVTISNLDASYITSGTICSDRIGAIDITTCNLNANCIDTGSLNADRIATGSLDADKITAGTITTDRLSAGAITADTIDANAITSDKIAAGAIASSTQIVCGVIAGCHLQSDSVITNTIQSTNFDGQLVNGEYTVGTQGFSMNASTGTLVLNSLVARNNIIAGNYICYNEEGGFAVDSNGNFKVAVDNDTLTVGTSGLSIKTIPDTAVITQTSDVNWTGGHDTVDLGVYVPRGVDNSFRYGSKTGDPIRNPGSSTYGTAPPLHVVPLTQAVGGPLVSMTNLTDIDLYNLTIMVDYSNVGNLATADYLHLGYNMFFSDDDYTRTNSGAFGTKTFTQVSNPVLPAGVVEYTIPSNSISFVNAQASTNRWGIGFISFDMTSSNDSFTGSVSISAKSSANSKLIIGANGEIVSPNRTFSDILSGA